MLIEPKNSLHSMKAEPWSGAHKGLYSPLPACHLSYCFRPAFTYLHFSEVCINLLCQILPPR